MHNSGLAFSSPKGSRLWPGFQNKTADPDQNLTSEKTAEVVIQNDFEFSKVLVKVPSIIPDTPNVMVT